MNSSSWTCRSDSGAWEAWLADGIISLRRVVAISFEDGRGEEHFKLAGEGEIARRYLLVFGNFTARLIGCNLLINWGNVAVEGRRRNCMSSLQSKPAAEGGNDLQPAFRALH